MKAAYFACIAVGLDPSVRNVGKASAAIRGLNGVAKPVWGEDVRTWLAAFTKSENDTLSIQSRHGSDTATLRKSAKNDTPATRERHPRTRVVKVLGLEDTLLPDADAPVDQVPPAFPDGLPKEFPAEVNALKRLTIPFLAAFANVKTDEAIKKHGPAYADVLATFRSRGVSVSQAWSAFSDALAAHHGKPLFANLANTSLRYLPARPAVGSRFAAPAGSKIGAIPLDELD